jgi:hypothetical protein
MGYTKGVIDYVRMFKGGVRGTNLIKVGTQINKGYHTLIN